MTQRGWHLDRQPFSPSLHLTGTHAHAAVADRFLADLGESVVQVHKSGWGRCANSIQVGFVRAAARRLPAALASALSARGASLVGLEGAALPARSAAMDGMMACLRNDGDVDELVLDILDGLTRPGATVRA